MIPLKLQIKNFVSYGTATQTIDFSPYQLICLSGKNGHGKSALLDALTWVLWGQARKTTNTSKADDGLLRLGQIHMMVTLDFIANGQQYRVRREYTQSPKNYTQLDFGIIDTTTHTYRPLTDKTIKLTQEKLETMLGLDFDAFSNSAFLRQGHSNEFSRKTPKERKEILAAILGINHFEKLRKRASEYAKEAHTKKEHFTQLCNTLSLELGQKTTLNQKITQLNQELNTLTQQEQVFKQALHEIKQQYAQLTAYKTKRDTLTFERDHTLRTLQTERTTVVHEITQLRQLFRQQRALRSYAHLEQERQTLLAQLQQLQQLNQKRLTLKETCLTLTHEKQTRTQYLTNLYTQKLQELTRTCDELTLRVQHTEQKRQELLEHYTKTEQALEKLKNNYTHLEQELAQYTLIDPPILHKREQHFEKRKAYTQTVTARIQLLTQELSGVHSKHELFKQQDSPTCPLCQQTIDPTYQHKVTQEFLATQRRIQRQLQRLTPLVTQLQSLVTSDNQEIAQIKEQAHTHALRSVQAQELTNTIAAHKITHQEQHAQLETLAQTHANYQKQLKQLQLQQTNLLKEQSSALKHDTIYQALNTKLHETEAQLAACVYSAEQEQELLQRLERITHLQRQQSDIAQALARKEEKKQAIHQKVLLCKQLTAHSRLLMQELEQYKTLETQEQALKQKEMDIDTTVTKIYRQKEQVLQQLGALESQKHTLEQRAQELKNHKIAITALDQTLYEYQALAQALSKDGIQALLIEDALPEIEQEANNLLSKLTDNQAHILLESLRDLRSGGTKETLDIKISDTIGTRPYELFSGGEAFRIDFALRIAISKLLARRAGTALQTLIIDEGFGSQDEEGLSAIMESLYKIQDEFAKIIVVSHLPALKDQFPVHFFIHKGPHGSTVKVLEHG